MAEAVANTYEEDVDSLISAIENDIFIEDDTFLNDIDPITLEINQQHLTTEFSCSFCTKLREVELVAKHIKKMYISALENDIFMKDQTFQLHIDLLTL